MEEINRLHDIADDIGSTSWGYELASALHNIAAGIEEKMDEMRHVLAADGKPLEVGQTVWGVGRSQHKFEVLALNNINHKLNERFNVKCFDRDENEVCWRDPNLLTHQRPVLDADGVPIHEGDTVYLLPGEWCGEYPLRGYSAGDEMVVKELCTNHGSEGMLMCAGDGKCNCFPLSYQLTHTKPEPLDTWERIEEDATLSPEVYCHRNGIDISQKNGTEIFLADTVEPMARDLVRRCREVAEREERGE